MDVILNSTNQINPVSIIIIAGFIIFLLLIYVIPTGPWFSAIVTGVDINIGEILLLRWRKIPAENVINGLIIAKKGGITVTSKQLQALYLGGGDIENVVHGLVAAKHLGYDIPFDKAAKANIKGLDIIKAVTGKALDEINQDNK
ncbi:MAG: hypothetical protein EA412_01225 [Chitinophagaceae bacterium]|nr:MAG: hypothetical protein EA412_01225 [Chitinophagaceae bacterium]